MKSRAWRSAAATLGCHRSTMNTTRGPSSGAPEGWKRTVRAGRHLPSATAVNSCLLGTQGHGACSSLPGLLWDLRIPEARPPCSSILDMCREWLLRHSGLPRPARSCASQSRSRFDWKQQLLFSHFLLTLPCVEQLCLMLSCHGRLMPGNPGELERNRPLQEGGGTIQQSSEAGPLLACQHRAAAGLQTEQGRDWGNS